MGSCAHRRRGGAAAPRGAAERRRRGREPGRFQLEAAIQSVHCDRVRTGVTDREALIRLYRALVRIAPTRGAIEALAAVESAG